MSNFTEIISKAAENLCVKERFGSWGETKTDSQAIWALCDCGFIEDEGFNSYITYCAKQLMDSNGLKEEDVGYCFNYEVWDTSLVSIALKKAQQKELNDILDGMIEWIVDQQSEGYFKYDPWETLNALHAILICERDINKISDIVKTCLNNMINMRNPSGVLISPHYMGLFLSVINYAFSRLKLSKNEKHKYSRIISNSLKYLQSEYKRTRAKKDLWGGEPWIIGHILLGIADSQGKNEEFFDDTRFNSYLLKWYNEEWNEVDGWVDELDTACTLIGLSNYFVEREVYLKGNMPGIRKEIYEEITSNVSYKFDDIKTRTLSISPIFKSRNIKENTKECFIIMPFREKWSNRLKKNLYDILHDKDYKPVRADDLYDPNVVESIWKGICQADIVIADVTGRNPNVFYELGIAHTLGKDTILITQNFKDIPFDIQYLRHIKYSLATNGMKPLKEQLPEAIYHLKRNI